MVKVWLHWHRCEAPAESRSPLQIQLEAEALLQLIWSSVTCWDMKPTLQSSSNLHTHRHRHTHKPTHRIAGMQLTGRHINTYASMCSLACIQHIRSEATVSLSHTHNLLQIHTLKGGSAMTMPPLRLLIGESQLKDWGISLHTTSCHFPMLRRWILSALRWYDNSPLANWNFNWPCL